MLCTGTIVCLWNCEGAITGMVITGLSNNLVNLPLNNTHSPNSVSNHELHTAFEWLYIKHFMYNVWLSGYVFSHYVDLPHF